MSEARKISPSPRPSTSGEAFLAATIRSGVLVRQHHDRVGALDLRAAPRAPPRPASARPPSSASSIRCATISVSVSDGNVAPGRLEPRPQREVVLDDAVVDHRRPAPALCGWAFSSDGRPCVAQRVWPMPIVPVGRLVASSFSSVCQLAAAADHAQRPAAGRARRRRPSRSRGTRAAQPARSGWAWLLDPDVTDDSAHVARRW